MRTVSFFLKATAVAALGMISMVGVGAGSRVVKKDSRNLAAAKPSIKLTADELRFAESEGVPEASTYNLFDSGCNNGVSLQLPEGYTASVRGLKGGNCSEGFSGGNLTSEGKALFFNSQLDIDSDQSCLISVRRENKKKASATLELKCFGT